MTYGDIKIVMPCDLIYREFLFLKTFWCVKIITWLLYFSVFKGDIVFIIRVCLDTVYFAETEKLLLKVL